MSGAAAFAPTGDASFQTRPRRRGIAWSSVGAVSLAVLLHVVLFAFLSLAWRTPDTPPPQTKPVEVSLVDEVALDQRAPKSVEPPAQSRAPDPGPPADAPPPAPVIEAAPEPTPPEPAPPKPTPPKPTPTKPKVEQSLPPKPAPKAAPAPKPAAKAPDKPRTSPAKSAVPPTKSPGTAKTAGSNPTARNAKATGSLLDDDFRKGLSLAPSKSRAETPPAATMDGKAAADIASAIQRQVQPCAARQSLIGPGVSRIVVQIHLELKRDGSLASRPTIAENHGGVDDENRRYVDAVDRAAIASFTGCAPLRGLPLDLYDVPRGWKSFTLRFRLPN